MITCTLRDKKYSIDFVSGRALRELEPAAQMYAKVVRLSELAAKGQTIPEDAKFTISEAMDARFLGYDVRVRRNGQIKNGGRGYSQRTLNNKVELNIP